MRTYRPDSTDSAAVPPFPEPGLGQAWRVLLVSDDPAWMTPVREAVSAAGGSVESVTAEAAVARLAGAETHVSHILADRGGTHGLLPTLAELTSDTASPGAVLLLLGREPGFTTGTRTIASADRIAIDAALSVRRSPIGHNEPDLALTELHAVVAGGMIDTRYQPIARLEDRAVMAVEVLARLNHPVHGTLTPDWFVPLFEDSGLAFTLTDLVSTRAFADQTSQSFAGLGLAMALNYPLNVLSDPEAAARLDEKRAALGIPPHQVVVELTESRPVEDFAALGRSVEHLRALGYRIAIDDVGPAVKNLDRLLALPFTGLKLDKYIVHAIGTGGATADYAPRVIEQALSLGLNIVAEGVETQPAWDRLRGLGVHEAQGFLVSRPLPAAAVRIWLNAWNSAPR